MNRRVRLTAWLGLELFEKSMLDLVGGDGLESKFKFLEHVQQLLSVDQFNWGRAIPCRLSSSFGSKRTGSNNDSLVGAASHCATKITNLRRRHRFCVALALEQNFERDKRIHLQRAEAVDSTVTTLTSYHDLREPGLAKNALCKTFKSLGGSLSNKARTSSR